MGVENGFNVGEIRTERDEEARAEIEMMSELHPVLGLFGWTIRNNDKCRDNYVLAGKLLQAKREHFSVEDNYTPS
ncbi:hypothetical protein OPV22_029783 [Ensete ventricosum]|uniref:Uncharacterized protein n=1 Tax=Ensete ventricosum TaxID=4639 RepID=A0AAV8Q493_ENSVE|nr:hypothetical protein OPV22_029783 [Ensete ventricosum]